MSIQRKVGLLDANFTVGNLHLSVGKFANICLPDSQFFYSTSA